MDHPDKQVADLLTKARDALIDAELLAMQERSRFRQIIRATHGMVSVIRAEIMVDGLK